MIMKENFPQTSTKLDLGCSLRPFAAMSFPPLPKPSPKLPESLLGERLRSTLPEWMLKQQAGSNVGQSQPSESSEQPGQSEPVETSPGQSEPQRVDAEISGQPGQSEPQRVDMETSGQPGQSEPQRADAETSGQPGQSELQGVDMETSGQPGQSTSAQPGQRRPPADPSPKVGCNHIVRPSLGVLDSARPRGQRSQNPVR